MAMCTRGAERKLGRDREEESQASTTVAFQNYGRPFKMVTSFKSPGKFLTAYDYTPRLLKKY